MPSTYTGLHYHIVFSTRNREPLIKADWLTDFHEYLGGTVRGLGGVSEGVGGVADHVHLLVSLKPTHCLSDFLRDLKKSSSVWMASIKGESGFRWQEGYSAFTVSPTACESVQRYIARQKEHHHRTTFREELIKLLEAAGIQYDEQYLD